MSPDRQYLKILEYMYSVAIHDLDRLVECHRKRVISSDAAASASGSARSSSSGSPSAAAANRDALLFTAHARIKEQLDTSVEALDRATAKRFSLTEWIAPDESKSRGFKFDDAQKAGRKKGKSGGQQQAKKQKIVKHEQTSPNKTQPARKSMHATSAPSASASSSSSSRPRPLRLASACASSSSSSSMDDDDAEDLDEAPDEDECADAELKPEQID